MSKEEKYTTIEAIVGSLIITPTELKYIKNLGIDLVTLLESVQDINDRDFDERSDFNYRILD